MNTKLIAGIVLAAMVLAVMTLPAVAQTDDVVFYFNTSDGSHDITVAPGAEVTIYFDADAPVNTTGGHEMSVLFDPAIVECLDVTENASVTDWHMWLFRGVYTATDPNLSYMNFDAIDFVGVGPGLLRCGDIRLKALSPGVTTLYLGLYPGDIPDIDHRTMICDMSRVKDWTLYQPFTITCVGPYDVDNKAKEDIAVSGTISGNHTLTHESDNVYESITEVLSTGKPATKRYSYLEHKWTIDVIDGSKANVTFYLEAYHSPSSDGDDFVFAYSANDDTYTDMLTVIKTADNNISQTYELPNDLSGTVHIRVKDTDRNKRNQDFDTVHIDQMFIRSVLAPPSYGVTVTIDEASQIVGPGNSTTYTVRVKNTGDFDASYSVVMSGTAVDENTIGVVPSGWITGTVAPNAENVQTVTVSTNSSTTEMKYTLTAAAICNQDAGVNDSATSELVVSSVTKTDDVVFYFNTSDGSHDITVAPGAEVTIYFDADAPVNTTGGHEMSVLFDPAIVECLDVTENASVTDWHMWLFRGVYTATDPNLSYMNFDAIDLVGVGPGHLRCGDIRLKAVSPGVTTLYLGMYPGDIPNIDHKTMICDTDAIAKDWTVSEPFTITCTGPSDIDNNTKEDIPVIGNVSGNHTLTHESDDLYESITEVLSTGKSAKKRYSYLEHKWTIDVIDGSKANVTFYLEAYHSPSSDGDDFVFAYSADDNTYTDMVTVIKTADNNISQTYELPNDLSGTVHIRVKDTDRNKRNQDFDTVHIDQMFIRSVLAPPSYGVTVTIDEASPVAPGNSYTARVKNTGD